LQVYDLAVARYGVEKVGYSYKVTGLINNEKDTPRKILVEAEDIPAVGKRSRAEIVVELPAAKGTAFELKVGMESLGPRRLGLRIRDPETREGVFWTSLNASRYPQLMQGYLDRNYYTREKEARAIFDLYLPAGKEQFIAELAVQPEGKKAIKVRAKVQDPRKTVIPSPFQNPAGDPSYCPPGAERAGTNNCRDEDHPTQRTSSATPHPRGESGSRATGTPGGREASLPHRDLWRAAGTYEGHGGGRLQLHHPVVSGVHSSRRRPEEGKRDFRGSG